MDFIHLGQFLSKLPDDIHAASLFQAIASINLMEQKFTQTLAMQKEVAAQIKSVTSSTKWNNIDGNLTFFSSTWVIIWSKLHVFHNWLITNGPLGCIAGGFVAGP